MTPLSRNCCSARLPVCPAARLPSCPQCTSFAELPVCPRAKLPLCLGARVAQLHYLVSCPAASIGRLSICPYTTTASVPPGAHAAAFRGADLLARPLARTSTRMFPLRSQ